MPTAQTRFEVRGSILAAIEAALGGAVVEPSLRYFGITRIDVTSFYPVIIVEKIMLRVQSRGDNILDLVNIGIKLGESVVLPVGLEKLDFLQRLHQLNEVFAMNTRCPDAHRFHVEPIAPNHASVSISIQVADDLLYGALYAYLRRVANDVRFVIRYGEPAMRQDFGAHATLMHINWT